MDDDLSQERFAAYVGALVGWGDRACGSGGTVARLSPRTADAGRAQERRADRSGDSTSAGLGQAPIAAAFRRQRGMVGRAGPGEGSSTGFAGNREQRAN